MLCRRRDRGDDVTGDQREHIHQTLRHTHAHLDQHLKRHRQTQFVLCIGVHLFQKLNLHTNFTSDLNFGYNFVMWDGPWTHTHTHSSLWTRCFWVGVEPRNHGVGRQVRTRVKMYRQQREDSEDAVKGGGLLFILLHLDDTSVSDVQVQ